MKTLAVLLLLSATAHADSWLSTNFTIAVAANQHGKWHDRLGGDLALLFGDAADPKTRAMPIRVGPFLDFDFDFDGVNSGLSAGLSAMVWGRRAYNPNRWGGAVVLSAGGVLDVNDPGDSRGGFLVRATYEIVMPDTFYQVLQAGVFAEFRDVPGGDARFIVGITINPLAAPALGVLLLLAHGNGNVAN